MLHSTRFKLVISFLIVSFLVGGVSLFISGQLLYGRVIREASNQVGSALNSADGIYRGRIQFIKLALDTTTLGPDFRGALENMNLNDLCERLHRLERHADLDFLGIILADGKTVCRLAHSMVPENIASTENPIARYIVENRLPVAGTVVLSQAFLTHENPELAAQIRFFSMESRGNGDAPQTEKNVCLAMGAGIPVYTNRTGPEFRGVLYGGVVLNQRTDVVDVVRNSFFPG